MPATMPCDKAHKKIIRQCVKKQEDDAGGKSSLPQGEKIVIKGKANRHPIYRFKIEDLAFNKSNGRIKSEVLEKESEMGRPLDCFDQQDQEIIEASLLSIRPDENAKIKEDLRTNGQLVPGIITCDGIMINGNRRKAILGTLYSETKHAKFKYIEAHVLPSDITKSELWLIEAGIQLSTPQQLDYSPINHLLKLREGLNAGLKADVMASRIYGVTEEKIKEDLNRLELIDEYLEFLLTKKDRYYLVHGLNEHFIDLDIILTWAKNPRGRIRKNWVWDESDINELKLVAFFYIRMRMAHLRIRGLRDIFSTKESWQQAKKALQVNPVLTEEEKNDLGINNTEIPNDEDEDETSTDETQKITNEVEEQDRHEEACWRANRKGKLKTIYSDAKEQEQIIKDSEQPLLLAQRALKNIDAIPQKKEKLTEPELDKIFSQIIKDVNMLRKIISKNSSNAKKTKTKEKSKARKN